MLTTTLKKIKKCHPCAPGWKILLKNLGKTKADDVPISLLYILEYNGLRDAIWCLRAIDGYDKEIRLFAVACIRDIQHSITDERSIYAIDVAERFANGKATKEELYAVHKLQLQGDSVAAYCTCKNLAYNAAWSASNEAIIEVRQIRNPLSCIKNQERLFMQFFT